jgi:hypothetical protein
MAGRREPGGPVAGDRSPAGPVLAFVAPLWQWDARRQDTWTFVTVPPEVTTALEDLADARGPRAGFGSVRVGVRLGRSSWQTSVFPDRASGCFVLPIKRAVREANGLDVGDEAAVRVHLL